MPDNYDRRLTPRDPDPMKSPKEGDKFFLLNEDGSLGEDMTVDTIGYDITVEQGMVYGVVPYEDDSRTYEIFWSFDRDCWIALREPVQATSA